MLLHQESLKRIFRCDPLNDDPAQIKYKLSEFGNRVLDDIWLSKGCPKNIHIVQQSLECSGNLLTERFGSPSNRSFDGVHMRGKMAVQHYTRSVINALADIMPNCKPIPAQPQPVRAQHNSQYRQWSPNTPATGSNRIPVGGDRVYNIRTQTRFTAVSGN